MTERQRSLARMFIISGPGGSGKTTLGLKLWQKLPGQPGYICVDNLKDLQLPPNATDYHLDLASLNARVLATNFLDLGHSVILVKAFGKFDFVLPFIKLAESKNAPAIYIKLTAPLEVLIERNRTRRNYTAEELVREMRWRRYTAPDEKVIALYEYCKKHEHKEGIEYNTAEVSIDEILADVLGRIELNRA